jgi:uncharacterized protein
MPTSSTQLSAEATSRPRRARRRRGGLGRFLAFATLWLATCWAVIGGLLAPLVPGGAITVIAAMLLTTSPLAVFLLTRSSGRYPGAAFRLFVMRPFWYVQLLLPLLAAGGIIGALLGLLAAAPATGGRLVLAVVAAVFVSGALAGLVGSRRLVIKRLSAVHPDLPPELDGLRIAQLSDLHVGPHTSRRHLARVARAVGVEQPDVVVVTGDLVDDHAPDVEHYAAALGALAAPLGVYAIPGNHDVYAGWPEVRRRLERLPLTVLVNESRILPSRGRPLAIVGTGDPAGRGSATSGAAPDLEAALRDVPDGAFVVALAHNPALWPALAQQRVPLTLSGHTHWGQFALPRLGWSLASPFLEHAMGVHERDGSLLYIQPGTNYWGIPFRLGTPPEVTVVTLRTGEEAEIIEGATERVRK